MLFAVTVCSATHDGDSTNSRRTCFDGTGSVMETHSLSRQTWLCAIRALVSRVTATRETWPSGDMLGHRASSFTSVSKVRVSVTGTCRPEFHSQPCDGDTSTRGLYGLCLVPRKVCHWVDDAVASRTRACISSLLAHESFCLYNAPSRVYRACLLLYRISLVTLARDGCPR